MCEHACVRACERACVRAYVRVERASEHACTWTPPLVTPAPPPLAACRAMVELRRALHENSLCREPLLNAQYRQGGARARGEGAG